MADDVILQYLKSIDERGARMEENFTASMQNHQEKDDEKHKEFDGRIKSLETSRTAARAGMTVLALGGTGGAAKIGLLDKVMSMFGGGA